MFNNNKGFTLIELLVTMSIVLLLFGFVLIDFKSGGSSLTLERSVETLAQNIRKASILTMSGQKFGEPSKIQKGGYGIYLNKTDNEYGYVLYGNENKTKNVYITETSNHIDDIDLEKGVKIKEIEIYKDGSEVVAESGKTSINFKAPDPIVSISDDNHEAIITLCLEEDCDAKIATIKVYKTGAVEIE